MKSALIIVGMVLSTVAFSVLEASAQTQPSASYTFSNITPADVELIDAGLQTQPFGKVAPLMNKLREQVVQQQQKPVEKSNEDKKE